MKHFVENCDKLNINELLREINLELRKGQLKSKIEALGQVLELTTSLVGFGGKRYWLVCPGCKARIGTLYKTPTSNQLLCRKCHNLTYVKSRYHKMM